MTTTTTTVQTHAPRWLVPAAMGLAGVSVALVLLGLGAESLWLDEMFTHYFAGIGTDGFSIDRSLEGVHPPFYYALAHYWHRAADALGVDFARSVRALSALVSVASLAVLWRLLRPWLSPAALALTVAAVSTSGLWIYFAQEARSYALLHLMTLILLALSLRTAARMQHGAGTAELVALSALAILGSATHGYMVLVAGGLFAALLLAVPRLRGRALIAACGTGVATAAFAIQIWTARHQVLPQSENWIRADSGFILEHIRLNLEYLSIPFSHAVFFAILLVLSLRGPEARRDPTVRADPVRMTVVTLALLYASAIGLTLLGKPVFSAKLAFVAIPLVWILTGFLIEGALQRIGTAAAAVLIGILAFSLWLAQGPTALKKQDWRDSARFVAGEPGCAAAPVPVAVHGSDLMSVDSTAVFYGHYLPGPATYLPVPRADDSRAAREASLRQRVRDIAEGRTDCPIVLWSVHFLPIWEVARLRSLLSADLPDGRELRMRTFGEIPAEVGLSGGLGALHSRHWGFLHLKYGQAAVLILD